MPLRLFHWSLVVLLAALWWTAENDRTELHEKLGYVTLGLLVFRLYWGLFGSSTARFSQFVKGPRVIAEYLRGESPASVGHNPLGALSVLLLLGLMIVEVGIGLFTQDVDGIEAGSLAQYISYETADLAREWHEFLFNVILGVVALHVLAILFYLVVKRDNLVGPMITGRKRFDEAVESPRMASLANALVGILLSAAIAWFLSKGLKL
ncbi:MAG: cytochrome b/b6 domain-containing protein [Sphingomonas sp.]|nr:cytochrome b/b6 domain-containing protein [Sphingomonas sp.]MBW0006515.1 cytochrome b/b6 domain-containing protein [Sphingomonas sp.]